ncbi:AMP nucleosidase, partial [Klebsiella pneumoniae]|nr:AMP nucleosidase [Klebsiella pneumoniae]
TPEQALADLEARYEASVTALRKAIGDYIDHNTLPDTEARAEGLFVYPQKSVYWDGVDHKALKTRDLGRYTQAGCYTP